jgi:anti-anti-sigma regulatory factor
VTSSAPDAYQGWLVFAFGGAFTLEHAWPLASRIQDAGHGVSVLLDFTGSPAVDPAGLALLCGAIERQAKELRLRGLSKECLRLLHDLGVFRSGRVLPATAPVEDA